MAKDETRENPRPKPTRKSRRDKQTAAIAAATAAAASTVAPKLQIGGRPRSLDPDQPTLDSNIKKIMGCAFSQMTQEETAATLGVAIETLRDFWVRYPVIREQWDATQEQGVASIRTQLFKNLAGDPERKIAPNAQTAMWMGERLAGIKDPYRERELAQREKLIEIRERDVAAKERLLDMRQPADFGAGMPIDIKSLSLPQLMQLLQRLREGMAMGDGALTIDAVRAPDKTD